MSEVIQKQKSAYFLSHNGLGDNITNIGAINFLLNYYETIFFLCKDIHIDNIRLFFDNKSVIPIPFNSNNEISECSKILSQVKDSDIFVSGIHKRYIKFRITHPKILNYEQNDNSIVIKYQHIKDFYYDNKLDLSIYVKYFNIDSNAKSIEYYESIKNFNIAFFHTKSSNREINLTDIINKYIDRDDYLIICANKNLYNSSNIKYDLANKFVNINIAYYIEIIKKAKAIHVIDSCFSCIVYPLLLGKKIEPIECIIHSR